MEKTISIKPGTVIIYNADEIAVIDKITEKNTFNNGIDEYYSYVLPKTLNLKTHQNWNSYGQIVEHPRIAKMRIDERVRRLKEELDRYAQDMKILIDKGDSIREEW